MFWGGLKMAKSYKYQLYMGTMGDIKNLERHFSRMAEKGWMIDKIKPTYHRYRVIEPCKIHFFVDFFAELTVFDYPENWYVLNYREKCEEAGWKFVTANGQVHVFCKDDDDNGEKPAPPPIYKSNKDEAKKYLKASAKYELSFYALYFFIFLTSLASLSRGPEILFSSISLFAALGTTAFILPLSWTVAFSLQWFVRIIISAWRDLPLPAVNYKLGRIRQKVLIFGILVFIICLIFGFVLEASGGTSWLALFPFLILTIPLGYGIWSRKRIDKKERPRGENIGIWLGGLVVVLIVVIISIGMFTRATLNRFDYNTDTTDGLPVITLQDLGINASGQTFSRVRSSFAVPINYEFDESGSGVAVRTVVYRTINRHLTRWLFEQRVTSLMERTGRNWWIISEFVRLDSEETAFWGADEAVAEVSDVDGVWNWLLLLRGRTMVQLTFSGNIDMETFGQSVRELMRTIEEDL
jgi:hypothetical protein